jgi:hypothetical protein
MLSPQKDKVWTVDYELGAALYRISNDLSHTLRGADAEAHTWSNEIMLPMIIFADDMQLYFDSRTQLEAGATEFINQ